jgi:hypothetical protein
MPAWLNRGSDNAAFSSRPDGRADDDWAAATRRRRVTADGPPFRTSDVSMEERSRDPDHTSRVILVTAFRLAIIYAA